MGCATSSDADAARARRRRGAGSGRRGVPPAASSVTVNGVTESMLRVGPDGADPLGAAAENRDRAVTKSESRSTLRTAKATPPELNRNEAGTSAPVARESEWSDVAEQHIAAAAANPLVAPSHGSPSSIGQPALMRGLRPGTQEPSESLPKSEGIVQLPGPALDISTAPIGQHVFGGAEDYAGGEYGTAVKLRSTAPALAPPHQQQMATATGGATGSRFTFSWARIGTQLQTNQQQPPPSGGGGASGTPPPVAKELNRAASPPTSALLRSGSLHSSQGDPAQHVTSRQQAKLRGRVSTDDEVSISDLRHNSAAFNPPPQGGALPPTSGDSSGAPFELGPPGSSNVEVACRSYSTPQNSMFAGANFSKAAVGPGRVVGLRGVDERQNSLTHSRGSLSSRGGDGTMVVTVSGKRDSSSSDYSRTDGYLPPKQVLSQYDAAIAMLSREGFSRRRELVMTYMKRSVADRVRLWIDHADHGETALGPLANPEHTAVTASRETMREQLRIQFGPPLSYPALMQLADPSGTFGRHDAVAEDVHGWGMHSWRRSGSQSHGTSTGSDGLAASSNRRGRSPRVVAVSDTARPSLDDDKQ